MYSLSPAQLSHEALAEAHHLIVRLALGVKVTATLRTDRKAATTVGVGYSKHTGHTKHEPPTFSQAAQAGQQHA